ncbi:MAG: Dabb family protein [Vicinamibacterales bacterium]
MLLHLVSFKYRAEVDRAARADHRSRLAALTGLDGVIDLKVGEDLVRSPRSYDTGLAITFPDRAALDAYQKNDQHVPVAQFGAGLCEHIVAVDFEI